MFEAPVVSTGGEEGGAFVSQSVPALSSSYRIPTVANRDIPNSSEWLSSSCGEEPFLTDDIVSAPPSHVRW